jgi:polyhydroxyalkanoate synthesis regulator phasin
MTYTAKEIVKELAYELHMRGKVYPRLVDNGKMTAEGAEKRKGIIKQILDRYELEAKAEEKASDPIEELDLFGD